jgi:hypothetical protein
MVNLLSPLSIESSPGSGKGGGGQKMTPELLNEAFSATTKTLKNPMKLYFQYRNEVGSRFRGNRQTDTQTRGVGR